MELITVRELFKNTEKYADREIQVGGWVRNRRPSKQFGFIVLNDGTYFTPVQVVYNDTLSNFQEISKINIGAALIIKGKLVLTPDSKQPFEIQADTIEVEGPSTGDYPLQPKRHTMEFLRTITICVPGPTLSRQCSVYGPWQPWPSISSSRTGILCMSTHPSSPVLTARVRAKCSRSPRWI